VAGPELARDTSFTSRICGNIPCDTKDDSLGEG
jgi:hypothetical protein